ncbi:AraC family transcriptional regulator [Parageobacillus thermoglucosidasius]|uniref:AraC family transcriptional regulator n=1 Tax=Parageobacillus thermoglucosidasius TaxID=1426 RepID=UPI001FCB21B8|nr:ABC transporter substrate-binding protein [Parageobacillus thermoglucosidasius]BDG30483.1 HTH-type transcriptional activator Btr [Parageobacillus thermoglucosidasius]GMO00154.1 bacillibactin transport transcriptional regulator Btr [Parageobacillus thermoglucosidasius]
MIIHHEAVKQEASDFSWDVSFLRLRDMQFIKGNGNWRMEQQLTVSHVLIVVKSGQGRLTLDHDEYQLRPDTVYVCAPGETYGIEAEKASQLKLFLFKFDVFQVTEQGYERVQGIKKERLFPLKGEIQISPAGQLVSLCDAIYDHWRSEDGLERFYSQFAFQELLYYIMKNRRLQAKESRTSLELAKEYMERYFNENLTIEQLARIANISPKYFVDLFKKTYGISAIDYLTELRINKAKQLMAQSDAKLRDIAHQVGYNDEFYFSRKFKKKVGVTPTVYMKSRRRKIAAYKSPITGQLLALKIIPYAAPLHPKWTAYYYKMYRADISVPLSAYRKNQHWESNIETLLHARPDMVISTDELEEREKEMLEQVAPVFYVPWLEKNWREQLLLTAEFLGETREAEHWLEIYERKVKFARDQLKREVGDDTFLIVRISKQNLYVHCNRSMSEVFYHDLQMVPAYGGDRFIYDQQITLDQLAQIDADRLLLLVRQEEETLAFWKALQYSMPWQELKAVRNNKVYLIPSDPWVEYSAYAHDRIIDESLRLFSGDCPK